MTKYWAFVPIAGTHTGWLADGKRIPLPFPVAFKAGTKLTVSFILRPSTVFALLTVTINGKICGHVVRASRQIGK